MEALLRRVLAAVVVSIAVVAAVVAGCGSPVPRAPSNRVAPPDATEVPYTSPYPPEVDAFVDRWKSCLHWAGEEPYDANRRADIEAGMAKTCGGNDDTKARLEAKYADRADVLELLRALPQ